MKALSWKRKFFYGGFAFGAFFPFVAIVIRIAQHGIANILSSIASDPLVWIIFSAPLVLGFTAYLIAKNLTEIFHEHAKLFTPFMENLEHISKSLTYSSKIQEQGVIHSSEAIAEMKSFISKTKQLAVAATEVTQEIDKNATEAARVVKETNMAMSAIGKEADEIRGIVGMVNEIAFQTNLLAINAAIEAAKSGEAGKGFAVVAIEVRDLAQRAAEAADLIRSLVEKSQVNIQKGAHLVEESSKNFLSVTDSLSKIFDSVNEISEASQSQFDFADNVGSQVHGIRITAKKNKKLVEDIIELGRLMAEEADRLMKIE